ncbi:MAG: serine/threonine protein kinase [Deltaproteobacteria bacterium]|nr:MAG: serine/threonine protein kinase [Deltaproteobacteria bacterium]
MSNAPKEVVDLHGHRYPLSATASPKSGGQGTVFEVEGGKLAVKILINRTSAQRERLKNQITFVKRLPLQDVAIAKPLAVLRSPYLGYVMELMSGMVPLKTLAAVPKGTPSLVRWYFSGGGLKRRLRLLAKSADILAKLHSKGLVYGDPSPANIFVSESVDAQEVAFIDADNLTYSSSPVAQTIYTPSYGAPELLKGLSGVNSLTDAHAFSVLAFQTLTLAHPLIGDYVTEGEPCLEEKALLGELPWIEHEGDNLNRCHSGIPREMVLSPELRKLCRRSFEEGLNEPTKRPGIAEWAERLHASADRTLNCPSCGGSYYYNEAHCPWCDHQRPTFVRIIFYLWDPSLGEGKEVLERPDKKPVIAEIAIMDEQVPLRIDSRLAFGSTPGSHCRELVELSLSGDVLSLKSLDGASYCLISASRTKQMDLGLRPVTTKLEPRKSSLYLHLGDKAEVHRVVRFEFHPGGPS